MWSVIIDTCAVPALPCPNVCEKEILTKRAFVFETWVGYSLQDFYLDKGFHFAFTKTGRVWFKKQTEARIVGSAGCCLSVSFWWPGGFLGGGRFYYMSAAGAEGWGGGCLQAVQDHLDHLGDSGIPVQEEEPRWSGGSSSTDWISVCACGAFTSIVCLSQTTGLLSDKKREAKKKSSGRHHPRTVSRRDEGLPFFLFPRYRLNQPARKQALCIQTAGCYGQSGNGGQGTDRGRGSRLVDTHHSHHGELWRAERFVPLGSAVTTGRAVCDRGNPRPCRFKV